MSSKKRTLIPIIIAAVLFFAVSLAVRNITTSKKNNDKTKVLVGHSGNPLLSFLYFAANDDDLKKSFSLAKFNTPADIGYGLLSGSVDVGFIEPERIAGLQKLDGFEKLEVIGKVTFPYGASLIVKKGSTIRLNELRGKKIAILSEKNKLFFEFKADLERYEIDHNEINFIVLAPDAIIPALETGYIDGAVVKGSQAVIAQKAGHKILYQKWEMEPGNECCPAIIDQLEFLLLTRKDIKDKALQLSVILSSATEADPSKLRKAISSALNIHEKLLVDLPLATYSVADNSLLDIYGKHRGVNHQQEIIIEEHHDDDEEHVHDEHCGHSVDQDEIL
jgi:ABC-type nitrate/sulfonate/bicarbonate transport system substrate-binding protein